MKLDDYRKSKYKDDTPVTTVKRIKDILNKLGIKTIEKYYSPGINGLFSCRITIRGTEIGQNGKGTTPEYALASGYAEFIERLSTGFLIPFEAGDKTDEGYPFVNIKNDNTIYISESTYRGCIFTNGSCAGNSKPEALTQGISELMERYASRRVITDKLTPPVIPEKNLQSVPEVYQTICRIRENKDYYIRIVDASLGMGLPVVGALLADKTRKSECIRFGAHPRFETALERAITELYQGVGLDEHPITTSAGFEYEDIISGERNWFNSLKSGIGKVSYKFFLDNPDWEYKEWKEAPVTTKGQYEYLLDLCENLGFDLYVRNCSFYGFDVFHVFSPQMGTPMGDGDAFTLQRELTEKYKDVFRDFPNASEKDQNRALNTIRLYKGFAVHEDIDFLSGFRLKSDLFGNKIDYAILSALSRIKRGEYAEAAKKLAAYCGSNNKIYVLHQLCLIKSKCIDINDARPALECMFDKEDITDAMRVFNDPYSVLPACCFPSCNECSRKNICDTYYTRNIRKNLEERNSL